jgi:GAF domain-containing protein
VVHIPDVHSDPDYRFVEALKHGEFRTILSVPMLREGVPIGVFALTRAEVLPFFDTADRQEPSEARCKPRRTASKRRSRR